MGEEDIEALREIGKLLSILKEPDPPKGMKDALGKLPMYRKVLDTSQGLSSRRIRVEELFHPSTLESFSI